MVILAVILISVLLTVGCILIHYELLRFLARQVPKVDVTTHYKVLLVIGGVFTTHLIEIFLYAGVYALMLPYPEFGRIIGDYDGTMMDIIYFSITSYTTLGVGDLLPHGPMRLIAGIQSLVGFILTGWSASFIYLAMERFWGHHVPRHTHNVVVVDKRER